ncbi:MAG: hypothetical protein KKA73_25200 [Chloroflexi bacterium]|nr:hypothetical protein [Chloroflexota bacterium]MBU1750995.1 hypothetical protein [Chloroflexota bacterium]
MPAKDLVLCQIGKQSVFTTAVAASAKLMGVKPSTSFKPEQSAIVLQHQGSLGPSAIAAQTALKASGNIDLDATYEDICFLLEGLFGVGVVTGSYLHTYSAPLSSTEAPRGYTIEVGTGTSAYKVIGALVNTLKISGEAEGVWQVAAGILGADIATVTLASLSDRTVELIRMADTVLYIDAWAGTLGATEASQTLISFELNIDPKRHLKPFAGSLYPRNYGYNRWEGTLKVVAEFNATAKAIVDAMLAPGLQQRPTSNGFCGHCR